MQIPIVRLQIRFELTSQFIKWRIIDTIPETRSQGQPCLLVRSVTIENSERDLDGILRSVITPFLEEGRAFQKGNLEKAIQAINKLGLFETLQRPDCRVRLSDQSRDDAVDVTFRLMPKRIPPHPPA